MDKEIVLNVDGSHNRFDYVDLGFPSGIKWATCNVGADTPEDFGLLFQFGRVDGYKYGDRNNNFSTADENEELIGNEYINPTASGLEYVAGQKLKLEDDAAYMNMGGDWIMPTKADLQELYDNTTKKVITINGKKGMLLTSKINGKSIFVAFAGYWGSVGCHFYESSYYGYLWSSEVDSNSSRYVWQFHCDFSSYCNICSSPRVYGFSVRGVLK